MRLGIGRLPRPSACTARRKSSPRSSKLRYWSNDAQPGASSTTSPGLRPRRRARTAAAHRAALDERDRAAQASGEHRRGFAHEQDRDERCRASRATTGLQSAPLSLPPRISCTEPGANAPQRARRSRRDSSPWSRCSNATPSICATSSSRCGSGRNARRPAAIASAEQPTSAAQASAAASAFARLCSPGTREVRGREHVDLADRRSARTIVPSRTNAPARLGWRVENRNARPRTRSIEAAARRVVGVQHGGRVRILDLEQARLRRAYASNVG